MTTAPMFLDTVSPATRKVLVSERVAAMRGRLGEACARLRDLVEITSSDRSSDRIALGLLWSELLHLDAQDGESHRVFEEIVAPLLASLPIPVQLVATDNLTVLQMADLMGEGISTFNHLVDRRRLAQFETLESDNLIAAQSAMEQDKVAEALPLLWQNLVRAHSLGSWRALRWATGRLASLYLRIGALEQAFHFLIMAEEGKEAEKLAVETSRRGDPDLIRAIIHRMMDFANLQRHFMVACKFLSMIPDFIPDGDVDALAEWLLPRCRERSARNGGGAMRAAWEVVAQIGQRSSESTSRKLIEAAISHPEWEAPIPGENRVLPNRQIMIKAVTALAHSASVDYLPEVLEATLPLATERAQNLDYGDVVNLLCNLNHLGGAEFQSKIRTALYEPGKPVNRILAQAASFFEIEVLAPEQWEMFANNVIDEIQLTVQRLKPEEEPKAVAETVMTMTHSTTAGERLQVTVHSGLGIEALIKGKQHLSALTIERMIKTMIEMATNPDNFLSNRENLLLQVSEFADRAESGLCSAVVRALEPVARGDVPESADYPNAAAGQHPMASAKMNFGTPQQVQARALIAAATFCGADSARSRLIDDALSEGFVSPHSMVRRGAYTAARRLPHLSGEQLLPILMGLRDSDPLAAVAAFAAFADRKEWSLNRPMWKLLLLAIRLASQSQDANLRRHAAIALRKRLADAPTGLIRTESEAILKLFASDAAYSVRDAAVIAM